MSEHQNVAAADNKDRRYWTKKGEWYSGTMLNILLRPYEDPGHVDYYSDAIVLKSTCRETLEERVAFLLQTLNRRQESEATRRMHLQKARTIPVEVLREELNRRVEEH